MDSKSYHDHFFKKAKASGYRSRSAFKLIELNHKFKFLKNGKTVLDIGSFPGGWCQVSKEKIRNGKILGVDEKEMKKIEKIVVKIGAANEILTTVANGRFLNAVNIDSNAIRPKKQLEKCKIGLLV